MRIIVAAVGRLKQGPETELSARYRKRAAQTGRQLGLRDVEVIEIRESRAGDAGKRISKNRSRSPPSFRKTQPWLCSIPAERVSTAARLRPSSANGGRAGGRRQCS